MGQGNDHVLLGDQILERQILVGIDDLRTTLVAEVLTDFQQLIADHLHQALGAVQDVEQVVDAQQHFAIFVEDLVLLERRQALQAHVEDFFCLALRQMIAIVLETELGAKILGARHVRAGAFEHGHHHPRRPGDTHQSHARLGRSLCGFDQGDDRIDIGQRDRQTFEDMRTIARLAHLEQRATRHHFAAMAQEAVQQFEQIERARLTIDQGHGVDAEHRLHLGMPIEIVEQHFRAFATLQFNDDTHAVLVGLVAQTVGAYALDLLVLDQFGDFLDQARLIDLIGQFGDDDARLVAVGIFDLGTGAHIDAAAPGAVGLADAGCAVDDAGGRKIGARNVVHQVVDAERRVVDQRDTGIDHFAEIMRRDIGRHADRDAARAIHQQVWNTRRQNRRLPLLAVVIGHEIDRVAIDVGEQLVGNLVETALGVTHGRRRVAIDRAEVALPVDERVAQREILRHAHQGVVDRGVAVGMVFTHHLTDHTGAFDVGSVPDVIGFLHREQHTAVHGFQPVTGVWQCASHDYAHRVIHVGLAHFVLDVDRHQQAREVGHGKQINLLNFYENFPATGSREYSTANLFKAALECSDLWPRRGSRRWPQLDARSRLSRSPRHRSNGRA